jgi:hypothetical protein
LPVTRRRKPLIAKIEDFIRDLFGHHVRRGAIAAERLHAPRAMVDALDVNRPVVVHALPIGVIESSGKRLSVTLEWMPAS